MYVYAVGNPVMYADESGYIITESVLILLGLATASVILIGLTSATQGLTNDLAASGHLTTFPTVDINKANVVERYKLGKESLISAEIDKAAKTYEDRSQRIHHIVARRDNRAKLAKKILSNAGISVDDPRNLVAVTQKTHVSLHTNKYFKHVNGELCKAVKGVSKNSLEYVKRVNDTLNRLQMEIVAMDHLSYKK